MNTVIDYNKTPFVSTDKSDVHVLLDPLMPQALISMMKMHTSSLLDSEETLIDAERLLMVFDAVTKTNPVFHGESPNTSPGQEDILHQALVVILAVIGVNPIAVMEPGQDGETARAKLEAVTRTLGAAFIAGVHYGRNTGVLLPRYSDDEVRAELLRKAAEIAARSSEDVELLNKMREVGSGGATTPPSKRNPNYND